MATNTLKKEEELRTAVIDRLIRASLNDGRSAREVTLERWRNLGAPLSSARADPAQASLA
jgi:hypothetical protein